MSGAELQQELHQIKGGELLGPITRTISHHGEKVLRTVCQLREGNIPETSRLASASTKAFVATDPTSRGNEQLVVALENINNGEAKIDIAVLEASAGNDPNILCGAVAVAMRHSDVHLGLLDPEMTSLSPAFMQQAGFKPNESGMYAIAA